MKREILFRGKRIDNGEWVYGFLSASDEITAFYFEELFEFEIDPPTVGQFTGLVDKNGGRIFEGDVVSKKRRKDPNNMASDLFHNPDYFSVVMFMDGSFMTDNGDTLYEHIKDYTYKVTAEIIGNIHDTPELKGGQK